MNCNNYYIQEKNKIIKLIKQNVKLIKQNANMNFFFNTNIIKYLFYTKIFFTNKHLILNIC